MNEAAKVVQHDRRHLSLLASSGSFRASQARALRQGGHRSQRIMKAIDGNGPQGRTVQSPPSPDLASHGAQGGRDRDRGSLAARCAARLVEHLRKLRLDLARHANRSCLTGADETVRQ